MSSGGAGAPGANAGYGSTSGFGVDAGWGGASGYGVNPTSGQWTEPGGFDFAKLAPLGMMMGGQAMQGARGQAPQPMAPPMMLPPMPQGAARSFTPANLPEMGPMMPARKLPPVQSLLGSTIQNMDPMDFNALIQGFTRGMRR